MAKLGGTSCSDAAGFKGKTHGFRNIGSLYMSLMGKIIRSGCVYISIT